MTPQAKDLHGFFIRLNLFLTIIAYFNMNKSWSYPKIIGVSLLVAIGMLLLKFLLRSITGSTFIRGDEFQDTLIWFAGLVVILTLQRGALIRREAIAETDRNGETDEPLDVH